MGKNTNKPEPIIQQNKLLKEQNDLLREQNELLRQSVSTADFNSKTLSEEKGRG